MSEKISNGLSPSSNITNRSPFEIEAPQPSLPKNRGTQNSFGHTIYNVLKAPFVAFYYAPKCAFHFLSQISSDCLKFVFVEKKRKKELGVDAEEKKLKFLEAQKLPQSKSPRNWSETIKNFTTSKRQSPHESHGQRGKRPNHHVEL